MRGWAGERCAWRIAWRGKYRRCNKNEVLFGNIKKIQEISELYQNGDRKSFFDQVIVGIFLKEMGYDEIVQHKSMNLSYKIGRYHVHIGKLNIMVSTEKTGKKNFLYLNNFCDVCIKKQSYIPVPFCVCSGKKKTVFFGMGENVFAQEGLLQMEEKT